jgi:hypothetical protein
MADPKQIEQELRDFLQQEDHIRPSDRLTYLMAIVNKHFDLDKIDYMVDHYDLQSIMSLAKSSYPTYTMPVFISKKEVHHSEVNYVLIIEAFVTYLNRNNLLKRLVRFDHTRR